MTVREISRRRRFMILTAAFAAVIFALLLMISAGIGVLVVASRGPTAKQWATWANIGQALQDIGTFLSALALVGVVAALWFQARQLRVQQQELEIQQELSRQALAANVRAFHIDLLKMGIGDPDLVKVWSQPGKGAGRKLKKQYLYANLIIQHHAFSLETGRASEENIRSSLSGLFAENPLFFAYWTESRSSRQGPYRADVDESRFVSVVDEEYDKVAKEKNIRRGKHLWQFR
jgi:Family of unknown function (DUF6082)